MTTFDDGGLTPKLDLHDILQVRRGVRLARSPGGHGPAAFDGLAALKGIDGGPGRAIAGVK